MKQLILLAVHSHSKFVNNKNNNIDLEFIVVVIIVEFTVVFSIPLLYILNF